MDLINWSLNEIDTIFSTRSLGFGEPVCPDGTFAAGYTRDAWERWQIVCLAALSVEDIEDIYVFGTMITGILLIGLGFALGYRKIQKTGTAVQSLTRLPVFPDQLPLTALYRHREIVFLPIASLNLRFYLYLCAVMIYNFKGILLLLALFHVKHCGQHLLYLYVLYK